MYVCRYELSVVTQEAGLNAKSDQPPLRIDKHTSPLAEGFH